MEALVLLIPLSVLLVFAAGLAFWWSAHSGQFDDLDGPSHRLLADDDSGEPALKSGARALTAIKPQAGGAKYDPPFAMVRSQPSERPAATDDRSDKHGE